MLLKCWVGVAMLLAGPNMANADPISMNTVVDLVKNGRPMKVDSSASSVKDGDAMRYQFDLPGSGYLNVVNIGPDGEATVLFPNAYQKDNRVSAGSFELPPKGSSYSLIAGAPWGKSLTAAFLSEEPINFYEESQANANKKSVSFAPARMKSIKTIQSLSRKGNIRPSGNQDKAEAAPYWAGSIEAVVCSKSNVCQ